MTGRPTSFTPEVGDLICRRLASGDSLRKVCREAGTPDLSTVMDWLMKGTRGDERYGAFAEQYAIAREAQAELLADEIIDIADEGNTGLTTGCDPDDELDGEDRPKQLSDNVQRARLRVDARKWVAAKLLPKKYGDRVALNHGGQDGDNPIRADATVTLTPDEAYRRLLNGDA